MCSSDLTRRYQNTIPVVRSVSMNGYMGVGGTPGYNIFNKVSDMLRPGPTMTFVILDESKNSINDGYFLTLMESYDPYSPASAAWSDVPATYHNRAGSLSFADGHSEIKPWKDPRTVTAKAPNLASPNNRDLDWVQDHATRKTLRPTR